MKVGLLCMRIASSPPMTPASQNSFMSLFFGEAIRNSNRRTRKAGPQLLSSISPAAGLSPICLSRSLDPLRSVSFGCEGDCGGELVEMPEKVNST